MEQRTRTEPKIPSIVHTLLKLRGRLHFPKNSKNLYTSQFARTDELTTLFSTAPAADGLQMGQHKFLNYFVAVHPQPTRRELGNLLIIAPTRGGKGLLAITQLLTWKHSVIVNDIKGELFTATAGYRSTLGDVFVIDPTGTGHRYDPLTGKQTEDELFSAATQLLFHANEGDGAIFTQRATVMLTQILSAGRIENIPLLPYIRHMVRSGPKETAARLHNTAPHLATQFLDTKFEEANFTDRFLLSSWGTLTARLRPILTETVIRSFTKSDFTAGSLLKKTTTVYLRWRERDLLALSPLVRLLWGTLIDELTTTYDNAEGQGCKPVLLLIDEAGRTAIPSLADHSTTVVGRGISLWIAIQSLSQLEAVYGKARAQVLRDNMESQIYYRPADLTTAKYLEDRIGKTSAFAQSTTAREGKEIGEGLSESAIPLLTAQHILQMEDNQVIAFHRQLPPFRLSRIDWRNHPELQKRKAIAPPELSPLPELADIPPMEAAPLDFHNDYIDPDHVAREEDQPQPSRITPPAADIYVNPDVQMTATYATSPLPEIPPEAT